MNIQMQLLVDINMHCILVVVALLHYPLPCEEKLIKTKMDKVVTWEVICLRNKELLASLKVEVDKQANLGLPKAEKELLRFWLPSLALYY